MSKGSKRRPTQIEQEVFESNWDLIFNALPKQILSDADKAKKEIVELNFPHRIDYENNE